MYNEPINIGAGEEIAIIDLINKIHALCESESDLKIGALAYRPTEIWRMSADNKNALKHLNWKPKVSFNNGLIATIDWFRKFYDIYFRGELSSL